MTSLKAVEEESSERLAAEGESSKEFRARWIGEFSFFRGAPPRGSRGVSQFSHNHRTKFLWWWGTISHYLSRQSLQFVCLFVFPARAVFQLWVVLRHFLFAMEQTTRRGIFQAVLRPQNGLLDEAGGMVASLFSGGFIAVSLACRIEPAPQLCCS